MSIMEKISNLKSILSMIDKVVSVLIKCAEYILSQQEVVND
uniref:Uncharacterized protein n=1 Tax=Dulem virus 196 TaxID=3145673 RepID=A0AAU8B8C8_9VIRU